MRITTWNVNGIRSLKNAVSVILDELNSDIVCFQETKISRNQLPETTALVNGYSSYFSYPRKQSGYSGVAIYCQASFTPEDAEEGLSPALICQVEELLPNASMYFDSTSVKNTEFDSEGRVIVTYHQVKLSNIIQSLAVINVYCPRVDPEKLDRHLYKMQFCYLLETKLRELCSKGCSVIIVGDLNICRAVIDHCDPCDEETFNASESRKWLNELLSTKIQFLKEEVSVIDAFRYFYPDRKEAYTCWNTKTGARLMNYGTRIDYILVTSNLLPLLESCDLLTDYHGSDHCPVTASIKCEVVLEKNRKLPSICTRLWPEFAGYQKTLQSFLQKTQKAADSVTNSNNNSSPVTRPVAKKSSQKSIASFFKTKIPAINNQTVGEIEAYISEDRLTLSHRENQPIVDGDDFPKSSQSNEWKMLMKGPPKPPLCSKHQKPCVLRVVRKKGINCGRQFFMCSQPSGPASNPDSNCNFFKWVNMPKASLLTK